MTSDAFGIAQPDPDGTWAAAAMQLAMDDAGMSPADVRSTSTRMVPRRRRTIARSRRRSEIIRRPAPVSSIKSMIGPRSAPRGRSRRRRRRWAIRHGVILPTINYETPDPECPLDVVPNVAREARVTGALSNSFGFGGQNGVLAFRRA
jgi:3-oxoacyl-[acyl-carrier-protein] synthase II